MKKSKAETARTRQRIVEVASEAIRNKGIDATGVAEIMAAAGLTHGGFYRHFGSKEALILACLEEHERDYILAVLRKCNWKIYGKGGAAEILDINVSTLNSRIKKLGLIKS